MISNPLADCGAAILCGGRSHRMGFDKALLLMRPDGRLLLASLAQELAEHFGQVILVTNDRLKLAGAKELTDWAIVEDRGPQAIGPVVAIYTALANLPGRPIFIMACDMPVLNWAVITKMREIMEREKADVVIPRHGSYLEPLYGFYGPGAQAIFRDAPTSGRLAVHDNFPLLKTAYFDLTQAHQATNLLKNINSLQDVHREGLNLMGLKNIKITRYEYGELNQVDDLTVVEQRVALLVNGHQVLTILATPQHLDYLALGLLFGEGLIENIKDVAEIKVTEDRKRIEVTLAGNKEFTPNLGDLVRLSGFGGGLSSEAGLTPAPLDDLASGPQLNPETICTLMEEFNQGSDLFRATGAVHGVAFINPGRQADNRRFDDIGRHNALDKVIGSLLAHQVDPSGGLILTTGRISTEILLKTHRAKIKMLISRSAPTDQAVTLARDLGLTLIGFARAARFNLYAGAQRLLSPQ